MKTQTLEKISEHEIVFQSVPEKLIAELKQKFLPLIVQGVNDKGGCKVVNEARKKVKKLRTTLEAERKIKKADSIKFGRDLDAEAKRLSTELVVIEDHLMTQEKIVTDEFARVKAAEQKAIEDKHKQQIVHLIEKGVIFNGRNYVYSDSVITDADIWNYTEEQFLEVIRDVTTWKIQEDDKKAEAEKLAKIEADKVAKEKAESEKALKLENERIEKEQAEIRAKQKIAQDKIDADKKELDDRQAKIEAAEKKIADEKAEVERVKELEAKKIKDAEEAAAKVEQDKLNKIEADKRAEMLKPDKQKLSAYISELLEVKAPLLNSSDAKRLYDEIKIRICDSLQYSIREIENL